MPRPLGSKNRPGSKKPGPKPGSKNKATAHKRQMEAIAGSSKRARIEASGTPSGTSISSASIDMHERVMDSEDVNIDVCGDGSTIAIGSGNNETIDVVGCVTGRPSVTVEATIVNPGGNTLAMAAACTHTDNQSRVMPEGSIDKSLTTTTCSEQTGYMSMSHKYDGTEATSDGAGKVAKVASRSPSLPSPAVGLISMPAPVGPRNQSQPVRRDNNCDISVGLGGSSGPREEPVGTESPGRRPERPVRLSPAMRRHISAIKQKIDANMRHKGGKAAPTKPGAEYPFNGPLILPGCPVLGHGAGPQDVSHFYLKAVFAWVPEYLWPDLVDFVPCPNCGSAGKPDGWTPQQPRRSFMEHGIAYIIGFRWKLIQIPERKPSVWKPKLFLLSSVSQTASYKCSACAEFNKAANIEDKRTTSYHAWDPACLERLPDRVSREYPFIPTRKSAMHVRLIDRLAHDLINGKGFAATANYIRQAYVSAFTMDKAKFESLAATRCRAASNEQVVDAVVPKADVFGAFDDGLKYSGAAPTEPYLRHVWRIWFADLSVKSPNITWTRADYEYRVVRVWDGPSPASRHAGTPKHAYARMRERVPVIQAPVAPVPTPASAPMLTPTPMSMSASAGRVGDTGT